ncbi:Hypothetical protein I595_1576 [Croceitalea dokdonensis DOKDO 023]|uniref:Uncharacterized protein n=1 Tax=Croceitalea dokdonensis DOKDO 023 TaxID=1300341 RepID=A0A0P7A5R2_9FLAO|nr:Hypothetical protein I595_1576 [Croceitalea dokdonensis DOKDO 023]
MFHTGFTIGEQKYPFLCQLKKNLVNGKLKPLNNRLLLT